MAIASAIVKIICVVASCYQHGRKEYASAIWFLLLVIGLVAVEISISVST